MKAGTAHPVLVHDNDPKHKAAISTKFLSAGRITCLAHPPQSPDLNPMENALGLLATAVRRRSPTNKEELEAGIKEEWKMLPQGKLEALVNSMPRRMLAVIGANGGHTKY